MPGTISGGLRTSNSPITNFIFYNNDGVLKICIRLYHILYRSNRLKDVYPRGVALGSNFKEGIHCLIQSEEHELFYR
ncbi:hypothetical protein V1477_017955 [Vespula maculifrons]|uniref:Uncharacterized protein n=1 Tax=Vespula maculifrons TaxID=7453 RepID=A0ABD2B0K8_VESMC